MDEEQLKRLDAITADYAVGGSPTAYVQTATAVVGKVGGPDLSLLTKKKSSSWNVFSSFFLCVVPVQYFACDKALTQIQGTMTVTL